MSVRKKVFVIMPFGDSIANDLYTRSTKPLCEEFGLEVERADEIFTTNPILDDIVAAIKEASVIIADISGKNPNVFYELGMSHMLKRTQTIMITHANIEKERIPFDIAHFRIIQYENSIAGKDEYEKQLRKTLETILADYKTIYKDEFELIIETLLFADLESELYSIMAVAKVPSLLRRSEVFVVEGHNNLTDYDGMTSSMSVEKGVATFIRMGYAEIIDDIVAVTDKGKAFVELLSEKSFVCDKVNNHILTEGYVPFGERVKQMQTKGDELRKTRMKDKGACGETQR